MAFSFLRQKTISLAEFQSEETLVRAVDSKWSDQVHPNLSTINIVRTLKLN